MELESSNKVEEYETLDTCLGSRIGEHIGKESLQNLDVLAMRTDFKFGESESAGPAVG